jgi:hypothetical protein
MRNVRWLVVAVCLAGCDDAASALLGDQDAGPKNVVVPRGDDATVGELTDDDRKAVCHAFVEAVDNNVTPHGRCEIAGILGGGSAVGEGMAAVAQRCQDIADTCAHLVDLGQKAAPSIPFDECGLFRGDTSGCDVDVGTLRQCLDQMAGTTAHAFEVLDCALLGTTDVPDLSAIAPSVPDTRPCVELQSRCPGALVGGAAPDAGPPADAGR